MLSSILAPILLVGPSLITPAIACNPPSGSDTGPFELGPDEYPLIETICYNINHFALNVANLTSSLHFYTEMLGMCHIFTFHADDSFKIAYLGYPSGGRNGTGYQTPTKLNRDKQNMQGLIELLYIAPDATDPPPKKPVPGSTKSNTFSHLGLVVPDMKAARKRMIANDVKIIKDVGKSVGLSSPVLVAFGVDRLPPNSDAFIKAVLKSYEATGGLTFLIVGDPDGNVIEIQPQY